MGWDLVVAKKVAAAFISKMVEMDFEASYDGVAITNEIVVETDASSVNAIGTITEKGWGLEVSDLFTQLVTNNAAISFVLGHELSHFFSGQLVKRMGWSHLEGEGNEILPDLLSAYVLVQMGNSWDAIINGVKEEQTNVFNSLANDSHSGQHPVASDRIGYLLKFKERVEDGASLVDAAKIILAPWKGE